MFFETFEPRLLLNADWQSPFDPNDTNADAFVSPLDVLLVVNTLNQEGGRKLSGTPDRTDPFYDVNGDGFVSPIDALMTINFLNAVGGGPVPDVYGEQLETFSNEQVFSLSPNGQTRVDVEVDHFLQAGLAGDASSDLLNVYVVNADNPNERLATKDGIPILSLSNSNSEIVPGLSQWNGSHLSLDIAAIDEGNIGLLFQLLNGDDQVRSMFKTGTISYGASQSAGGNILDRQQAYSPGPALDIADFSTDSDAEVSLQNVSFDIESGVYSAELSVFASEGLPTSQVVAVFENLPQGVSILNSSGELDGLQYINLSNSMPRGGLDAFGESSPTQLLVSNPNNVSFKISDSVRVGAPNVAPEFDMPDTVEVAVGNRKRLELVANDADGNLVTYGIAESSSATDLPLSLTGSFLDIAPKPGQAGEYPIVLRASDGDMDVDFNLTIRVTETMLESTLISGRILEIDESPIQNMLIEVGSLQATTDENGDFTLDLGAGVVASDTLRIRGDSFGGDENFPFIAEKIPFLLDGEIVSNVDNVISRPIYLPRLAPGTQIDPSVDVTVSNPEVEGTSVFVRAGTLLTQQGTPFRGELSITEVPVGRTPASLPGTLFPDTVVTIQPGELQFATPATMTFPNRAGYLPGTRMNLWSIDPTTGEFADVGDMVVSPDGTSIETTKGGVRNSSWHFPAPEVSAPPSAEEILNQDEKCPGCEGTAKSNSRVELHSGALNEIHNVSTFMSQGKSRSINLVYNSERAAPSPIVSFSDVDAVGNDNTRVAARLSIQSGNHRIGAPGAARTHGFEGGEHFWKLSEQPGDVSFGIQTDIAGLATGVYSYELWRGVFQIDENEAFGAATVDQGEFVSVNRSGSPFGAGWEIEELSEVVETQEGDALLVQGNGSSLFFRRQLDGSFRSPAGDFSTLRREADGSYLRIAKNNGSERFSASGKLMDRTDRNGNSTTYSYLDDRLTKITDPGGLETKIEYRLGGLSIFDPSGWVTALGFDNAGNLSSITQPDDGIRTFSYDEGRRLTTETDQLGRVERTVYDASGRVSGAHTKDGRRLEFQPLQGRHLHPFSSTTEIFNAPEATPLVDESRHVQASGQLINTVLDQAGQVVSSRDSEGNLPSFERDEQNNVTRITDSRRNETVFTYDALGNVTSIQDSIGMPDASQNVSFTGLAFSTDAHPEFPFGGTGDKVIADFDFDGADDLVLFDERSSTVALWLGRGDGTFFEPRSDSFIDGFIGYPQAAYVDEDSHLDLVYINTFEERVEWLPGLLSDGVFNFAAAAEVLQLPTSSVQNLAVSDVDNDGISEIFARSGDSLHVATLGELDSPTVVTSNIGPNIVHLRVDDFDRDGRYDVVATTDDSLLLYEVTDSNSVDFRQSVEGTYHPVEMQSSFLDEVVSFVRTSESSFEPVFLDDDGMQIGPAIQEEISFLNFLGIGDFNGDLLSDFAVRNGDSIQIYVREADSYVAFDSVEFLPHSWIADMNVADLNNDGLSDVMSHFWEVVEDDPFDPLSERVVASHASITLMDHRREISELEGREVRNSKLVDLDGDDVLDLVGFQFDGSRTNLVIRLGQVDGTFADSVTVTNDFGRVDELQVFDADSDGNLDLVYGDWERDHVSIYYGNGNGQFIDSQTLEDVSVSDGFEIADLNSDGLPDFVIGSKIAFFVILASSEREYATPRRFSVTEWVDDITVGDFQNNNEFQAPDGRPDIVTVDSSTGYALLFQQQPNGDFELARFEDGVPIRTFFGDGAESLVAGDFNGDGNDDLAVVRTNEKSVVISNGWASTTAFDVDEPPERLVTHDLTGNGDEELFAMLNTRVAIIESDGTGAFQTRQLEVPWRPSATAVEDIDADGVSDLVVQSSDSVTRFFGKGSGTTATMRSFVYDEQFSQLLEETDELGRRTIYTIDPVNGNRTSMRRVVGELDTDDLGDDLITSYAYTASGLLEEMVDPLGRMTRYAYDSKDQLISVTSAVGTQDEVSMSYEYDIAGNRTASIDALGHRTEYSYDSLNRLIEVQEPDPDGTGPLASPIISFEYDVAGNLVSHVDAEGSQTSFTYDELNRLTSTIDALGNTNVNRYDASGNLIAVVDPLGNISRSSHDSRGRVTSTVDAVGGKTSFSNDGDGNLRALTDPVGNTTRFFYDARSRLVQETDPLGAKTIYTYDAVDNLIKKVDRLGRMTEYTYDDLDRLIEERWIEADQSTVANTITYIYDKVGNLLEVYDNFSHLTYTYDNLDRVKIVDNAGTPGAPHVVLEYEYNANGNVLSVKDIIEGVEGGTNNYRYDALNRMIAVEQSGNDVSEKAVDFLYNQIGQFDEINRFSNLARTSPVATTEYDYDAINRLTDIDHVDPSASTLAFFDYQYDVASRITQIEDIHGTTDYSHDDRSQLTGADRADSDPRVDESYSYDANGNRKSSHLNASNYETGPSNRLLTDGVYRYDYDSLGNMTSRLELATGAVREFEWDHRSRLAQIKDYSGLNELIQSIDFTYDWLNRRIRKSTDIDEVGEEDSRSTLFLYDGEQVLFSLVDHDDTSNTLDWEVGSRYLHGPDVDQILAVSGDSGGWALTDHLGSPHALVTDSGNLFASFLYDSFGTTVTDDRVEPESHLFTGRELNRETGLYFYRARFYDASIGRFIAPDPIGFGGSDTNLFRYVANSPLDSKDPTGTIILRLLHYSRNSRNKPPAYEWQAKGKNWDLLPRNKSVAHQFGEEGHQNRKYVSPDGRHEAVYRDGRLVTDPTNMGTYNVFGPENEIGHAIFDVIPYILYGNSFDDPTWVPERILQLARALWTKC